ncbi:MAG: nickel pincer cofactor biosynthesis protein LarB [Candidatus Omnitrophota bacterium]
MRTRTYADLGFACVDTDRQNRRGFPEVVFCQNKTRQDILKIALELNKDKSAPLLLTRLKAPDYKFLKKKIAGLSYRAGARAAFRKGSAPAPSQKGVVLVVTAGTSDIPVAEEAVLTVELMGADCRKLYDVGVAGVHRILERARLLRQAAVIIVVAGMEGALASVVSGLVKCPVVAVPTSCGYGSSFEGLSALLTMLNSCSPGVAVMNIDNGFGAGYFAGLVTRS